MLDYKKKYLKYKNKYFKLKIDALVGGGVTEAIWKTIANRIVEKNDDPNKKTEEITVEEKNKAKTVKKKQKIKQ